MWRLTILPTSQTPSSLHDGSRVHVPTVRDITGPTSALGTLTLSPFRTPTGAPYNLFPTKSDCKLPCSRFNGSISPANWPRGHSHPLGGSWSASPSELTEASPHRSMQGFGSGIRVIDFSPSSFSSSSTSPTALQRYTFPKCPELWGAKHGRDRQAVLASELVLGWYSCPRLRSLLRLEPPSAAVLGYSCPRLHDHPYLICRGV